MKCRWGIIGCGWVARDYMLPAILDSNVAILSWCCDRSAVSLDAIRVTVGRHATHDPAASRVRFESDVESMLHSGNVDAVYIATPNHTHAALIERCVAAGLAVLVEKPIGSQLTDAPRLRQIAGGGNRPIVGVAYDQRHHPAHVELRSLIAGGSIGRVTQVRILYACWLPARWSPDGVSDDNWRIDPVRAGGGAVIDLLPHGLDLVSYLIGESPLDLKIYLQRVVQEYAASEIDDGGVTSVRYSGGVLTSIHNSYACPDALPRRILEVYGSRGMLRATNTMGQTPGGEVELYDDAGNRHDIHFAKHSPFAGQVDYWSRIFTGRDSPDRVPFCEEIDRFELMLRALRGSS